MTETLKQQVEAATIEHIRCPSCGAPPGQQCTYTTPSPLPCAARTKVKTHQRRLSAFISSEHCRFSTSRPIHVLNPIEQETDTPFGRSEAARIMERRQ